MQDTAKSAIRRLAKLCNDFTSAFIIEKNIAELVHMHILCLKDKTPDPLPFLRDDTSFKLTEKDQIQIIVNIKMKKYIRQKNLK